MIDYKGEEWIRISDGAREAGVSHAALYNFIKRNRIRVKRRSPHKTLVKRSDVADYIAQHAAAKAEPEQ